MTSAAGQAELRGPIRYLHAFRAHKFLILLICVVAVGIAAAISYTATEQFDSSADIQIQALSAYGGDPFQGFDLFRQATDGSSPVVAAARVLSSVQYSDAVYKSLGPAGNGVSFAINPLSQADILNIGAVAPTAARAAQAANAYENVVLQLRTQLFQKQLAARIKLVQTQIASIPVASRATSSTYSSLSGTLGTLKSYVGLPDPTILKLTPATTPGAPSWPRPKLSMAAALVIGLLIGGGAAVGLELMNPRITREDDLTFIHRLPILARIPRASSRTAHGYLAGRSLLPNDIWKGYRTLRAVLANAGPDGGYPKSILVTSASPGDGKTMTAVNLAIALASSDMRVTLVDADFHRPMVGTIFNVISRGDGLVRLLANPDSADTGTVASATHPRIRLLLGNREQMHHLNLLDTQRFKKLLDRLAKETDIIVIDSPPVPEVAEALALAEAADTVVISVRMGHTRRDKLSELRELLSRRGVSPLGFIVTTRARSTGSQSAYDYAADVPTAPGNQAAVERIRDYRTARGSEK